MQLPEVVGLPGPDTSQASGGAGAVAPRSIAVVSQKGGVGKTTVSLNLALSLAQHHGRTLLVDTDPQGGIGLSLARPDAQWTGLVEAFAAHESVRASVVETREPRLCILPRGRLNPIDVPRYERALGETGRLHGLLSQASRGFDYVVVDTPAGVGMVTVAVLQWARFALPLYQASPLAARSIGQVLQVIQHLKDQRRELDLLGLLPTMVSMASKPSQGAVVELWTQFEGVLETTLPLVESFAIASEAGLPLAYMERAHAVEARRFDRLADELVGLMRQLQAAAGSEQEEGRRALV